MVMGAVNIGIMVSSQVKLFDESRKFHCAAKIPIVGWQALALLICQAGNYQLSLK